MSENKLNSTNDRETPASPKTAAKQQAAFKKEKTKYQAFKSDEEDCSDFDEVDLSLRSRRKPKKDRINTSFKVKIINIKGKKKEKEKEKEKKKKHKKIVTVIEDTIDQSDLPLHEPIFGVSLDVAVERSAFPDKFELPRIVRECILYVENKGLTEEGLYRLSGVKSKVDHLKKLYNEGRNVNLEEYDANCVTSLLKLYLRELPSNILTTRLAPIFDAYISCVDPNEQLSKYQQLLHDLPCPNRTLLAWLFTHFAHILDKSHENKMNIQNLSIVFSPTMSISHGVLNLFFQFTKDLFPDVVLFPYNPPEESLEVEESIYPDNIGDLQRLLYENEDILNKLHECVNQSEENNEKTMDNLWERQRMSTQIKRRIKEIKKLEILNQMEKVVSSDITKQIVSEDDCTIEDQSQNIVEENQNEHVIGERNSTKTTDIKLKAQVKMKTEKESKLNKNKLPGITWTAEIVLGVNPDQTVITSTEVSNNQILPNTVVTDSVTPEIVSSAANNVSGEHVEKQPSCGNLKAPSKDLIDNEYKVLLLEERRLLIENQELNIVNERLFEQIQSEENQIEILREKLNEKNSVDNNSLTSSSSTSCSKSSSCNSLNLINERQESEKYIFEMEKMLYDLEEENKKFKSDNNEMVSKICEEKRLCVQLKTQIRMYKMNYAVK